MGFFNPWATPVRVRGVSWCSFRLRRTYGKALIDVDREGLLEQGFQRDNHDSFKGPWSHGLQQFRVFRARGLGSVS